MLHRQSIHKKSIKLWWFIIGLIGILFTIELVDYIIKGLHPLIRSIGSLTIIMISTLYCYRFVYHRLSEFNYKIISNEVILERVVGRGNGVSLIFRKSDILALEPYNGQKLAHRDIFTNTKPNDNWYVVRFTTTSNQYKRVIIEPDQAFLEALKESEHVTTDR